MKGLSRRTFSVVPRLALVAAAFAAGCTQNAAYLPTSSSDRLGTGGGFPLPPPGAVRAAGALLPASMDEELWVIERPIWDGPPRAPEDEGPGTGALMAKPADEEKEVPLPLEHTDVRARVSGYIATVDVTQKYHNPYDEKIEAVYVFPLPHNAAVNDFLMTIGERKIRGIIRERKEAERIYHEARRQGYVASLLTQERPNIFTQSVANIEPGKSIDVNIRYFHTMAYDDGWLEFVFPMVVGPRFNPPGTTTGVGAVPRGGHGTSGQKTKVQYLRPGERSGHDISLVLDIDAGLQIEGLECPSHGVDVTRRGSGGATVSIRALDAIPNKDFVLRYKVAGAGVASGLLVHRDARGGYFTLMLYPPEDMSALQAAPVEMIFVLDCSGSMSGSPIAKAKTAIERALRRLGPGDTFQIIRFSNDASQLGPAPIEATPANVRRGLAYLASLQSQGGTMMIEGIRAALDFPHDPQRLRIVSFLTDGYIGNEADILAAVKERVGSARIFSFGVGSSVNRYLLEGMARLGRGAVAFVGLDESAGRAVDLFYERIRRPAMTDVAIDWGGIRVAEVYPAQILDLFVGRPVVLTGRFSGDEAGVVRVMGTVGGERREVRIPVDPSCAGSHPGIASVWARRKIMTLADEEVSDPSPEIAGRIRDVALEYGLMSAYTAFVAVDSLTRTAGDHGTTVPVAVPVPAGVKYETTVPSGPSGG
ncbi:MAG: VWA domain-containing protein [Planctomycetes bacterium]|nr:VWA domain-containing protein [Planctomycetota bacterium]